MFLLSYSDSACITEGRWGISSVRVTVNAREESRKAHQQTRVLKTLTARRQYWLASETGYPLGSWFYSAVRLTVAHGVSWRLNSRTLSAH
jgi:hypothetical protein